MTSYEDFKNKQPPAYKQATTILHQATTILHQATTILHQATTQEAAHQFDRDATSVGIIVKLGLIYFSQIEIVGSWMSEHQS